MPTLPIVLSHGQRHTRYNRRALTTAPKPRGRQPVYVEPLQACAERWIALARRYKIAMFGIAGAVIAVYCPPNPFQSARAKHAHLGAHYPARYKPSESRCAFSRARCPEDPTTLDEDAKQAAQSLEKLRFKLEAMENLPPSENIPPSRRK